MKRTHYLLIVLAFGLLNSLSAQLVCTPANRARLQEELTQVQRYDWTEWSGASIMVHFGKRWLGVPYVSKTLEVAAPAEPLVINLQELDCTTFIENVVVLACLAHEGKASMEKFQAQLTYLRYREGKRAGYASRLHYTTDWFWENAQKGIIQNVTQSLGGIPMSGPINFMSTHRSSYTQLSDDKVYEAIKGVEEKLNTHTHYYLPKAQLASKEHLLKEGDIVALTTSIRGLDVVHIGLITFLNERPHLLHASTGSNQVEVSQLPLADYIQGKRHMNGIMVARLVF